MTGRQLHSLLHGLEDTHELVMRQGTDGDVLAQVWRSAQDEADDAYADWQERGGGDAYLTYRAAADRADAALDAMIELSARPAA